MANRSGWRTAWNLCRFVGRAFMDPHALCKDVGTVWAEHLLTRRSPTLWTVLGMLALTSVAIVYCCWIACYAVINRVITGKWGLYE